jgi:hypothetical protein
MSIKKFLFNLKKLFTQTKILAAREGGIARPEEGGIVAFQGLILACSNITKTLICMQNRRNI